MSETIVLPRAVVEEIAKRASALGVSTDEYLADSVLRFLDPEVASEKYLEASLQLLQQAREELSKGDLRQAGEKVWGACALAIKAYALATEGRRLESHAELWVYKDRVAGRLGGWVRVAFMLASSMHVNFYEGLATREDVEDALREVERLVKAVAEALRNLQR